MRAEGAEVRQPKSSIERVAAEAERLGLDIEVKTFEQSTRTAEEAAEACGCDVAQIVKSLVFVDADTGALVLVLVSGAHALDTAFVDERHGLRLERCDTRRVRSETGFAIGGVAPIGHLTPIRVLMDETLAAARHRLGRCRPTGQRLQRRSEGLAGCMCGRGHCSAPLKMDARIRSQAVDPSALRKMAAARGSFINLHSRPPDSSIIYLTRLCSGIRCVLF